MPKLYQHELRSNLRALNEGTEPEQINSLIDKTAAYINLNKKYFPEDHLKIFDEMVKESLSFESFFSATLKSSVAKEDVFLIFLPATLYDICTDHKHDFIGQTHQKLIKIIRDAEEYPETYPETDELYSEIINCDEERVNSHFASRKGRSHHTLNTGNWLIEFLKSHIELEKEAQEAAANETKQQSSWTDRATRAIPVSEIISEVSKKKSVSFAASVTKGGSEDGKGPGFI